jgi:hypothetical protein
MLLYDIEPGNDVFSMKCAMHCDNTDECIQVRDVAETVDCRRKNGAGSARSARGHAQRVLQPQG